MDPTQGGAKSVGLPTARWHVRCGRPLGSRCLQIADADQVVRRRREGDDPVDECAPAMPHLGLIRFGGHLPKGEYDVDHDGHAGQARAAELHG